MREDYQESLDKMFPKGYVIVYTFDNSEDMRCHYYNPIGYDALKMYRDTVLDASDQEDFEV